MTVLDSSAVLAYLQGEAGADRAKAALSSGLISAANWSEVAQKVRSRGGDWALIESLLYSYGLVVEPVTAADGERAAALWLRDATLSLADRLCLATAERLKARVLTADRAWGDDDPVEQLR